VNIYFTKGENIFKITFSFLLILLNTTNIKYYKMKKTFFLSLITIFVMSSCVSKKEYTSLENRHKQTQDLLNSTTVKLNACLAEKSSAETLVNAYKEQISDLKSVIGSS